MRQAFLGLLVAVAMCGQAVAAGRGFVDPEPVSWEAVCEDEEPEDMASCVRQVQRSIRGERSNDGPGYGWIGGIYPGALLALCIYWVWSARQKK